MSLMSSYSILFGPMFDNGELEAVLREQFTRPRHTNDFRKLRTKLYVGVTDQDRREHVLLGDSGYEDIPISKAVQASSAMHPFFPSVPIHGRYYTDGAITRTSNIKAAIQKGADLVFVVDPFLPLISEEAGFNARQGNLWVMQQDIKTLAYTRFAQISEEVLRQHQVQVVGRTQAVKERYYAISVERIIKHPAVAAIFEAARHNLFIVK